MNKIYELLGLFTKHLKTFLCSEEILTECDTYFVKNRLALKSRRSSLKIIKNNIYNKIKKIQKNIQKRANSVLKGIKKEKTNEEEKKEIKDKENTNFFYLTVKRKK